MQIYNSYTRRKETFTPLKQGIVGMYVCGPTVYGPGHLGHASTYTAFDIVRRAFEYLGYTVHLVINITDVHDDMIRQAKAGGITIFELADTYITQFLNELSILNIEPADAYPRVTEHISEIVNMVKTLERKGYAYETGDGVYFDVKKFPTYGSLSGIKLEHGRSGQRIDTDKYEKEGASDFALWKKAKEGEPHWSSPWGEGRPGWHIECSVMSRKHLGQPFDIHGGALDLRFPHHENEVAQSEAAYGKPLAVYWMHAGLLKVDGQKMSKSLGNYVTIPELLSSYDPMAIRYWRATVHYRSELQFSKDQMVSAESALRRLRDQVRRLSERTTKKGSVIKSYEERFTSHLENDFSMPEAVSVLWDALGDTAEKPEDCLATVLDFDRVLGLRLAEEVDREKRLGAGVRREVESLVKDREKARKKGNWEEADEIRKELEEKGIDVEDTPDGPVWRVKQ